MNDFCNDRIPHYTCTCSVYTPAYATLWLSLPFYNNICTCVSTYILYSCDGTERVIGGNDNNKRARQSWAPTCGFAARTVRFYVFFFFYFFNRERTRTTIFNRYTRIITHALYRFGRTE